MILALALAAHWAAWSPEVVQMGVSIGYGSDERLVAMVPAEGCAAGLKTYYGRYGDMESGLRFIAHSKVCSEVDARRSMKATSLPLTGK